MIDASRFEQIRHRHGPHGSWAVWAPAGDTPKSNMGDITVLDPAINSTLLDTLNPAVVMVGLNLSRVVPDASFRDFHDSTSVANDFKIRYAFSGTNYWGAYMTDVIKEYVEPVSGRMMKYLRDNPHVIARNIEMFREELRDLGHPQPVILAFGADAYSILEPNLDRSEYSRLVRLTHYSHQISKEKYRTAVLEQIAGSPAG